MRLYFVLKIVQYTAKNSTDSKLIERNTHVGIIKPFSVSDKPSKRQVIALTKSEMIFTIKSFRILARYFFRSNGALSFSSKWLPFAWMTLNRYGNFIKKTVIKMIFAPKEVNISALQAVCMILFPPPNYRLSQHHFSFFPLYPHVALFTCLLYTSDAADE